MPSLNPVSSRRRRRLFQQPAFALAVLLSALIIPQALLANVAAVAGSSKDRDLLGKDENADGLRDDLAMYLRSLAPTEPMERALLNLARARTRAMMTNPLDGAAVRKVMNEVFNAKGCLTQKMREITYQLTIMSRLDQALTNTPLRKSAMQRVMEADRFNVRSPTKDGKFGCRLPPDPQDRTGHVARFPGEAVDGSPVNYVVHYAKPGRVAASENDTDLLGKDEDEDGVRDDLQAYVSTVSKDPKIIRALHHKAKVDTQLLLSDPEDQASIKNAMQAQFGAWTCLNRDIRNRKDRTQMSRRLGLHLLNTEQRAIAMRKVNLAMAAINQKGANNTRVSCNMPEVVAQNEAASGSN